MSKKKHYDEASVVSEDFYSGWSFSDDLKPASKEEEDLLLKLDILMKSMGYKNVKVTQASGDFGADVLAFNTKGEYVCIQCKHYIKPVGIKAVQEIYSAKQYYKCQKAMVITNSTFTQAAIDLANKTGVDLWPNFR